MTHAGTGMSDMDKHVNWIIDRTRFSYLDASGHPDMTDVTAYSERHGRVVVRMRNILRDHVEARKHIHDTMQSLCPKEDFTFPNSFTLNFKHVFPPCTPEPCVALVWRVMSYASASRPSVASDCSTVVWFMKDAPVRARRLMFLNHETIKDVMVSLHHMFFICLVTFARLYNKLYNDILWDMVTGIDVTEVPNISLHCADILRHFPDSAPLWSVLKSTCAKESVTCLARVRK